MTGFVYFARCHNSIKIGHSFQVGQRISALATGNPFPIDLLAAVPGSMNLETAIHNHLFAYRISREWFHDHEDVRAVIADLQARGPSAIGFDENEWKPPPVPSNEPPPTEEDLEGGTDAEWSELLHEFTLLYQRHRPLVKSHTEAKEAIGSAHVRLAMLNGFFNWGIGPGHERLRAAKSTLGCLSEKLDAIARAEAALAAVSVQDPEFAGAGLDALREALRIPRGAVARAAGKPHKPKARRA